VIFSPRFPAHLSFASVGDEYHGRVTITPCFAGDFTMKWTLITLVMLSMAGSAWLAGAEPAKEEGHSYWMKKKLEFAEHILAGMATADFDKISTAANSMKNLNQIEEWARRKNADEYRTQLHIFRFANSELVRQAEKKNIDGVALAYSQLTLSCVNCHKLLRDSKD
jgi:cytochrome c556